MKKSILISIIFSFLSIQAFSQNYMYIGDKEYIGTPNWKFSGGSITQSAISLSIAKNGKEGYLFLSTGMELMHDALTGNVYLYLENGKRITCYDKGIKDRVNDKNMGVYSLNANEIQLLKTYRITQVRYSMRNSLSYNKKSENFSASNGYSSYYGGPKNYSATEDHVRALFSY